MNWDCTFLINWDFTPTTLWRPTENLLFYSQHLNFYSKKIVNFKCHFLQLGKNASVYGQVYKITEKN